VDGSDPIKAVVWAKASAIGFAGSVIARKVGVLRGHTKGDTSSDRSILRENIAP